jgi:hypothetical protein
MVVVHATRLRNAKLTFQMFLRHERFYGSLPSMADLRKDRLVTQFSEMASDQPIFFYRCSPVQNNSAASYIAVVRSNPPPPPASPHPDLHFAQARAGANCEIVRP